MPGATLLIETPEGPKLVPLEDVQIENLDLSDSRPRMADLKKIAKALGLSEDADESAIVAKAGELADAERPELGPVAKALGLDESADQDAIMTKASDLASGSVDLDAEAKRQGKKIVSSDDFDELKQLAARGAKAADELRQSRFDARFENALDAGRVDAKDSTKERFQKLYDADADATLELLDELPQAVNTAGRGSGAGEADVPEGQDAERTTLDREVRSYMAEHNEADYLKALDRVEAKRRAAA